MTGGNKNPLVSAERVSVEFGGEIIAVKCDSVISNINVEDYILCALTHRNMISMDVSLAIVTSIIW